MLDAGGAPFLAGFEKWATGLSERKALFIGKRKARPGPEVPSSRISTSRIPQDVGHPLSIRCRQKPQPIYYPRDVGHPSLNGLPVRCVRTISPRYCCMISGE